jgi:hypothetical protein
VHQERQNLGVWGRADAIHVRGIGGPNPTNEIEKNGYQAVCSVDENS